MKTCILLLIGGLLILSCSKSNQQTQPNPDSAMNILFLHHSTGDKIWNGGNAGFFYRITRKVSPKLAEKNKPLAMVPRLVQEHNRYNNTNYRITELAFPKVSPYGWHNYPFDYYDIWVKHAGPGPYMEEPTLEMLTDRYKVIVFKHCFPVSNIKADADTADIDSNVRTLANYKLQYLALRDKLRQFPETTFLIWTGAVQVQSQVTEDEAIRTREFFTWVREFWDEQGDNIYLWDFYQLETEGGLYLKEEYAASAKDSHPNTDFSKKAAALFVQRLTDVVENKGSKTDITGQPI
jgi:hypothetical protein